MKIVQLMITAMMLLIAITGCRKSPEASITANKTTAAVNETITVTSTSKNANTYSWIIFDGNSTSGVSSSSHVVKVSGGDACDNTYSFKIDQAGNYTLRFVAYYYKGGCSAINSSGYSDGTTLAITIQ